MKLSLTATNKSEELILKYLQENASDSLANKINNGVKIVKDGKELLNKKTLSGFMKYASEEARKLAEKGANSACVEDSVVYGWAIHYFEENSIEEKLFNLDGTEFKPVSKPKNTQKPTYTPISKPKPKEHTLFDLLCENEDIPNETTNNNDEITEEDINETQEEIQETTKPKGSPIYEEYMEVQNKYPNHVICFRLGDFYEVFGDNAKLLSNKLDLTLTSRDCGLSERIPMIGFPYHIADVFFNKIVNIKPIAIVEDNDVSIKEKEVAKIDVDLETGEILSTDLEEEQALKTAYDKDVLLSLIDLFGDILTLE